MKSRNKILGFSIQLVRLKLSNLRLIHLSTPRFNIEESGKKKRNFDSCIYRATIDRAKNPKASLCTVAPYLRSTSCQNGGRNGTRSLKFRPSKAGIRRSPFSPNSSLTRPPCYILSSRLFVTSARCATGAVAKPQLENRSLSS